MAVDPHSKICNPLLAPDLLYAILGYFRPEYDPIARRTLASLARTCSTLSEPALDLLWKKLGSLLPLIRSYARVEDVENLIPPTPSDFAIIDRYSHRIRELTVSERTSVCFLKCTNMLPSLLLPNLTVLRWNPSAPTRCNPVIFIQRLLSPTLVSLEVTLSEADEEILALLGNLPKNLKSIEIHFSTVSQSTTTIQALSRAVDSQMALEKVVIDAPVDDMALRHLSTLPTLKVLNVELPKLFGPQTYAFLPGGPVFCSVEKLEFGTLDLNLVTSLLRPQDQIFHTFHLRFGDRLRSMAAVTFLNALASRSPENPLRELTLSCGDFSHPLPVEQMASEAVCYRLSHETLKPLTVFSFLRHLTIEWSEQISLNDDELANLAHSWPRLRVLQFFCGRGGYLPFSTKYPTLRGLLSLVTACPGLYTVSLPLDATHVPDVDEAESCPYRGGENLQGLAVPESPIDQARPVAEFLFTHFPSLEVLDARFGRPPGTDDARMLAYARAWQDVEICLGRLRGFCSDSESVVSGSIESDDGDGEDD